LNSAENSDIKIIIYDATDNKYDDDFAGLVDNNTIIIFNKIDIINASYPDTLHGFPTIGVSIKSKKNLDALILRITDLAGTIAKPSESAQITRARHRAQLEKALEYMGAFACQEDLILAAEDLRMTVRAISSITGKITVDEILGEIFSNFCIGK
jgi:tRNA modification GTPase